MRMRLECLECEVIYEDGAGWKAELAFDYENPDEPGGALSARAAGRSSRRG